MADKQELSYKSAVGRWAGVGPYYAMFPVEFAFDIVGSFTKPGDFVLDPFAGRGTCPYAASSQDRIGIGIEINPVGWVYGKAKLETSSESEVLERLRELTGSSDNYAADAEALPEFFHYCFSLNVRKFLLAARSSLDWLRSNVDATLMALILVYLHGKKEQSLSNQMRQTKSMSPEYSIEWWKEHSPSPPEVDPLKFMLRRINWRYKKGHPKSNGSHVIFGDSTEELKALKTRIGENGQGRFSLLFTSPPYFNITNYFYDQWLRLWLLGGAERPKSPGTKHKRKFQSKEAYEQLLKSVFEHAAPLLTDDATIYVRTDARDFTQKTTLDILRNCFPLKEERMHSRPYKDKTQTALFGDHSLKPGEVDIVLTKKTMVSFQISPSLNTPLSTEHLRMP